MDDFLYDLLFLVEEDTHQEEDLVPEPPTPTAVDQIMSSSTYLQSKEFLEDILEWNSLYYYLATAAVGILGIVLVNLKWKHKVSLKLPWPNKKIQKGKEDSSERANSSNPSISIFDSLFKMFLRKEICNKTTKERPNLNNKNWKIPAFSGNFGTVSEIKERGLIPNGCSKNNESKTESLTLYSTLDTTMYGDKTAENYNDRKKQVEFSVEGQDISSVIKIGNVDYLISQNEERRKIQQGSKSESRHDICIDRFGDVLCLEAEQEEKSRSPVTKANQIKKNRFLQRLGGASMKGRTKSKRSKLSQLGLNVLQTGPDPEKSKVIDRIISYRQNKRQESMKQMDISLHYPNNSRFAGQKTGSDIQYVDLGAKCKKYGVNAENYLLSSDQSPPRPRQRREPLRTSIATKPKNYLGLCQSPNKHLADAASPKKLSYLSGSMFDGSSLKSASDPNVAIAQKSKSRVRDNFSTEFSSPSTKGIWSLISSGSCMCVNKEDDHRRGLVVGKFSCNPTSDKRQKSFSFTNIVECHSSESNVSFKSVLMDNEMEAQLGDNQVCETDVLNKRTLNHDLGDDPQCSTFTKQKTNAVKMAGTVLGLEIPPSKDEKRNPCERTKTFQNKATPMCSGTQGMEIAFETNKNGCDENIDKQTAKCNDIYNPKYFSSAKQRIEMKKEVEACSLVNNGTQLPATRAGKLETKLKPTPFDSNESPQKYKTSTKHLLRPQEETDDTTQMRYDNRNHAFEKKEPNSIKPVHKKSATDGLVIYPLNNKRIILDKKHKKLVLTPKQEHVTSVSIPLKRTERKRPVPLSGNQEKQNPKFPTKKSEELIHLFDKSKQRFLKDTAPKRKSLLPQKRNVSLVDATPELTRKKQLNTEKTEGKIISKRYKGNDKASRIQLLSHSSPAAPVKTIKPDVPVEMNPPQIETAGTLGNLDSIQFPESGQPGTYVLLMVGSQVSHGSGLNACMGDFYKDVPRHTLSANVNSLVVEENESQKINGEVRDEGRLVNTKTTTFNEGDVMRCSNGSIQITHQNPCNELKSSTNSFKQKNLAIQYNKKQPEPNPQRRSISKLSPVARSKIPRYVRSQQQAVKNSSKTQKTHDRYPVQENKKDNVKSLKIDEIQSLNFENRDPMTPFNFQSGTRELNDNNSEKNMASRITTLGDQRSFLFNSISDQQFENSYLNNYKESNGKTPEWSNRHQDKHCFQKCPQDNVRTAFSHSTMSHCASMGQINDPQNKSIPNKMQSKRSRLTKGNTMDDTRARENTFFRANHETDPESEMSFDLSQQMPTAHRRASLCTFKDHKKGSLSENKANVSNIQLTPLGSTMKVLSEVTSSPIQGHVRTNMSPYQRKGTEGIRGYANIHEKPQASDLKNNVSRLRKETISFLGRKTRTEVVKSNRLQLTYKANDIPQTERPSRPAATKQAPIKTSESKSFRKNLKSMVISHKCKLAKALVKHPKSHGSHETSLTNRLKSESDRTEINLTRDFKSADVTSLKFSAHQKVTSETCEEKKVMDSDCSPSILKSPKRHSKTTGNSYPGENTAKRLQARKLALKTKANPQEGLNKNVMSLTAESKKGKILRRHSTLKVAESNKSQFSYTGINIAKNKMMFDQQCNTDEDVGSITSTCNMECTTKGDFHRIRDNISLRDCHNSLDNIILENYRDQDIYVKAQQPEAEKGDLKSSRKPLKIIKSNGVSSILSNLACIEDLKPEEVKKLSLPQQLPDLIVTSSGESTRGLNLGPGQTGSSEEGVKSHDGENNVTGNSLYKHAIYNLKHCSEDSGSGSPWRMPVGQEYLTEFKARKLNIQNGLLFYTQSKKENKKIGSYSDEKTAVADAYKNRKTGESSSKGNFTKMTCLQGKAQIRHLNGNSRLSQGHIKDDDVKGETDLPDLTQSKAKELRSYCNNAIPTTRPLVFDSGSLIKPNHKDDKAIHASMSSGHSGFHATAAGSLKCHHKKERPDHTQYLAPFATPNFQAVFSNRKELQKWTKANIPSKHTSLCPSNNLEHDSAGADFPTRGCVQEKFSTNVLGREINIRNPLKHEIHRGSLTMNTKQERPKHKEHFMTEVDDSVTKVHKSKTNYNNAGDRHESKTLVLSHKRSSRETKLSQQQGKSMKDKTNRLDMTDLLCNEQTSAISKSLESHQSCSSYSDIFISWMTDAERNANIESKPMYNAVLPSTSLCNNRKDGTVNVIGATEDTSLQIGKALSLEEVDSIDDISYLNTHQFHISPKNFGNFVSESCQRSSSHEKDDNIFLKMARVRQPRNKKGLAERQNRHTGEQGMSDNQIVNYKKCPKSVLSPSRQFIYVESALSYCKKKISSVPHSSSNHEQCIPHADDKEYNQHLTGMNVAVSNRFLGPRSKTSDEMMKNNNKIPISLTSLYTTRIDPLANQDTPLTDCGSSMVTYCIKTGTALNHSGTRPIVDNTSDDVSSGELCNYQGEFEGGVVESNLSIAAGEMSHHSTVQHESKSFLLDWYRPGSQATISTFGTTSDTSSVREDDNEDLSGLDVYTDSDDNVPSASSQVSDNNSTNHSETNLYGPEEGRYRSGCLESQYSCGDSSTSTSSLQQNGHSCNEPVFLSTSTWCHPQRKLNRTLSNIHPLSTTESKNSDGKYYDYCRCHIITTSGNSDSDDTNSGDSDVTDEKISRNADVLSGKGETGDIGGSELNSDNASTVCHPSGSHSNIQCKQMALAPTKYKMSPFNQNHRVNSEPTEPSLKVVKQRPNSYRSDWTISGDEQEDHLKLKAGLLVPIGLKTNRDEVVNPQSSEPPSILGAFRDSDSDKIVMVENPFCTCPKPCYSDGLTQSRPTSVCSEHVHIKPPVGGMGKRKSSMDWGISHPRIKRSLSRFKYRVTTRTRDRCKNKVPPTTDDKSLHRDDLHDLFSTGDNHRVWPLVRYH